MRKDSKRKIEKATPVIAIGLLVLLLGLGIYKIANTDLTNGLINQEANNPTSNSGSSKNVIVRDENGKAVKEGQETTSGGKKLYINETTFKSDSAMPIEVYEYPFQKTVGTSKLGGTYVNNKDMIATYDNETLKRIEEDAKQFIADSFSLNYHSIEADTDSFKANIERHYLDTTAIQFPVKSDEMDGENLILKPMYFSGEIADWAINNKVQSEATFTTDDSLIYGDDQYIYVRGVLDLDAYNCDDEKGTCDCLLPEVNYNTGGKYIVDVCYQYYGYWYPTLKEFAVNGFQVVGQIND